MREGAKNRRGMSGWQWLAAMLACALTAAAAQTTQPETEGVVLDRVVAVVNRHAILNSDIEEEIRLAVLSPAEEEEQNLTPRRALEQLISRTLIEQQIRREDERAATPSEAEVQKRLNEIRRDAPLCAHHRCASEEGWRQRLAERGLTPERVERYLRYRLQILAFIELRFRQGIRISPEEIAEYYAKTIAPQYKGGETAPTLESVAGRIEEILLERQVNRLFDDWLTNLRRQGDVEVLDPALEEDSQPSGGKGAGE